jgi:alkylated DNA nucleotide flippase Atl1
MTEMRCVHGIDSRFCAVCNKVSAFGRPRAAIGSATLAEILEFLNAEQVRATYGAVAALLGVIPRGMGAQLGPHTQERSWIVNADTGLPTDYSKEETHPLLQRKADVISSGMELAMRMTTWKTARG